MVENALRTLEVQVVLGVLAPWQRHIGLQVVELHTIIRTLGVKYVEFFQLFLKDFSHFARPFLIAGFLFELSLLGRAFATAQLFLDVLDLLLQEVLALLFVELFTRLHTNLIAQLQELQLAVEQAQGIERTVHQVALLEKLHLVFNRERQSRAEEVQTDYGIMDVVNREHHLVCQLVILMDKLL